MPRGTLSAVIVLSTAVAIAGCGRGAKSAHEYVQSGDRYMADQKYSAAIVEYRNAVRRDGTLGEARYKLGRAYAMAEQPQNALHELVRAADLLPRDVNAQIDAAKALLLAGRYEDAKVRAEAALNLQPKSATAHIVRGSAIAGLKDLDGAVRAFEDAITASPNESAPYLNLATLQAVQGQRQQAEASFKQAIAAAPTSPVPHIALANYYWASGNVAEAEASLTRALALDPKNDVANRALAMVFMNTRRVEQAEAPLKVVAEASADLRPKLVLADYYSALHRVDEAKRILTALAADKDAFAAASVRLAGIEYEAGDRTHAHELVEQVLAREPKNAQVLVVKGGWLLAEGHVAEALQRAQAAVAADNKSPDAESLLGSAQLASGDLDAARAAFTQVLTLSPEAVRPRVELSRLNLRLHRNADAVKFAEDAIRLQPNNGEAHLVLSAALLASGTLDRADQERKLVADANPRLAQVHLLEGEIARRRGNTAQAQDAFERALALDPSSAQALEGLVYVDVHEKAVGRAVARVESQVAKAPQNARLLMLAGRTLATSGDNAKAEMYLKRAIAADPSLFDAYTMLGQLYVSRGKLDDARREYETLVKSHPSDVSARTMVAMILQVQGNLAEASKQYEQVLATDPRAVVALNNLAYMHAEAGSSLDVALNLAQTAKAALPDDPDVNDTLGWIYYKRDLPKLALDPLRQSIEKDPANATYRYHLGMSYLKAGDKARGRTELEQAIKLQPTFDDARRALASVTAG